jgi:hypothetical protein
MSGSNNGRSIDALQKRLEALERDRHGYFEGIVKARMAYSFLFFLISLIFASEILCSALGWPRPLDGKLGWIFGIIGAVFVVVYLGQIALTLGRQFNLRGRTDTDGIEITMAVGRKSNKPHKPNS